MKRFIRDYLLENWTLKITALLLSLILWMFVRGEPGPERVVAVPLEVQLSRNMEITNQRPTSVEVTMRGAAFSNMLFNQPLPTCVIDLQGAKEGEHVITLTPENVVTSKGSGIEVLQVNPVRVTLVLERTISREVPITVPVRGEPVQGFEIYGKSAKPSTVMITGPRSRVDSIREVPTESVQVSGQKQNTRFMVGLNIRDNAVRTALNGPVQADIRIGPRRRLFTISQVPVATDDPDFTISPRYVSVRVLAPADSIATLKPNDFNATVLTKKLDPARLPAKVEPLVAIVSNPNGALIIREVAPSEVLVRKKK